MLQVLNDNAAVAAQDRLSEIELVLDQGRLQRLRAEVDAEAASLLTDIEAGMLADEIKAARLKEKFWDSMQVICSSGQQPPLVLKFWSKLHTHVCPQRESLTAASMATQLACATAT